MKTKTERPKRAKAPSGRWKAFRAQVRRLWRPVLGRVVFCLGPFVDLLIVEILNEKNPFVNLNLKEWNMNLALYLVIWVALWLATGRLRRTARIATGLLFAAGLVNHYVLEFKGRVLFPNDIVGWRTAANVVGSYDLSPDVYIWGAIGVLVLYLLLVALLVPKQEKRRYFHIKWVNVLIGAAAAGYVYAFFFSSWLPSAGIKTQQWKTQSNGWVLNFSIALRYSRVEKPDDYSMEAVEELTESLSDQDSSMTLLDDPYTETSYEPDTVDEEGASVTETLTVTNDEDGTQPLNIICIMDESFADLSIFDLLTTDSDAVPFYHSLTENTIKGWMYSAVTGGGTASVEYEFLTGNSIAFLPLGTVAYQLYVKDEMPSLISWANALGFETTTFHPYESSGWNRVDVYNKFGVDTQLYNTDVTDPSYVRGYISDSCDFEVLESITSAEEGDRQFIFNVTMQNHGGYKQTWYNLSRDVLLTGSLTGVSDYAEQYLALMRETDRALEELIEYYSSVDEPTLIVFFGDHQGQLSDWFYEKLYGKDLDDRTIAEVEQQYVVPFFIWANYDIDEAQDVMISTNYLGALLAQVSNYPTTGYMDFLANLYEEIPVIGRVGYITADGTVVEDAEDLPEETQALLAQYEMLSYYNLFQRDEDIDNSFFLLTTSGEE
ncbi:MAG: LTA synthase family protein [Clostridiales bacterium]|nr:LTA synthase family protein [Clostridiales bacterium]